jgi:hypothetical protein
MSCGECEGLSRRALMVADDNGKSVNCSSMGKEADAKPCGKFRSDLLSLSVDERVRMKERQNLLTISKIILKLSTKTKMDKFLWMK